MNVRLFHVSIFQHWQGANPHLDARGWRSYAELMSDQGAPVFLDAELRPNRSLSPVGFKILMAVFACAALVPGLVFFAQGAWPVVGFLGLDVAAVYLAFRMSYAQGRAREYIRVTPADLDVVRVDHYGRVKASEKFPSYWTRVSLDDPPEPDSQLTISAAGRSATIGRFLSAEERAGFAAALRQALARARQG